MKCLPTLLLVITNIVNRSLEGAFMPNALKCTMITPLLKKSNLDPEEFKNLSSVSNLPFTSKFIEKTVAAQLMQNIGKNNLSEKLQSAYKKLHSTETTLLKVQDIASCGQWWHCGFVILLDLSAAFDAVDHSVLLHRFKIWFGIKGRVFAWFKSYLAGQSQFVSLTGTSSSKSDLMYGVLQGSILGPISYLL